MLRFNHSKVHATDVAGSGSCRTTTERRMACLLFCRARSKRGKSCRQNQCAPNCQPKCRPIKCSGQRSAGAVDRLTVCWGIRAAKVELSISATLTGILPVTGYPLLVTRSPGKVNLPSLLCGGKSTRTNLSNAFQSIDPGEQVLLRFWGIEFVTVRQEAVQNIGHAHRRSP